MDSGTIFILGGPTIGNVALVAGLRRLGLTPVLARPCGSRRFVSGGDVAIARLDVLPTLDGVEQGLLDVLLLERRGVRVLNPVRPLLAAHDKLRTISVLARAGIPHPRTVHVTAGAELALAEPPVVVKPRFGSWGADVIRCRDRGELERCAREVRGRRWFHRHGALVQELLPPSDTDLRVVVAGGAVVGAIERTAAPGEWRTNVSLGGSRRSIDPPRAACELALRAAAAAGSDLVGVDVFPLPGGSWTVLELNGAVDFDDLYSLPGRDVYTDLAAALDLAGGAFARTTIGASRPSRHGG